jgi:hypothetical protein
MTWFHHDLNGVKPAWWPNFHHVGGASTTMVMLLATNAHQLAMREMELIQWSTILLHPLQCQRHHQCCRRAGVWLLLPTPCRSILTMITTSDTQNSNICPRTKKYRLDSTQDNTNSKPTKLQCHQHWNTNFYQIRNHQIHWPWHLVLPSSPTSRKALKLIPAPTTRLTQPPPTNSMWKFSCAEYNPRLSQVHPTT